MNAITPIDEVVDVLIVGAGISGIGMAVHLARDCPDKRIAIVDRREQLGGTWDLFRYPGIRSDSDMFTLGYAFAPWLHEKAIADGATIREYLGENVDRYGLRERLRLGRKVISADWDSAAAHWVVETEDAQGRRQRMQGRFLFLGSGYYDYDEPYDAGFKGREKFKGQIVHPQFWPQDLDYQGKKVVVIGSGATAVTVVPAMANSGAGHVTMLQRTPTWMISRPARDRVNHILRKVLPEKLAYKLTRAKNILLGNLFFKRSRSHPDKIAAMLTGELKALLGPRYTETDFKPPYNPWDQRVCLVPDADLFEAIKDGRASVVTDQIESFDASGIKLQSGKHLDADIVVTATGLRLAFGGKIALSLDGKPVDISKHFFYRSCMFSNLPNLAGIFGYVNAGWTLRVDIVAQYLTRLLRQMEAYGAVSVTPELPEGSEPEQAEIFDFSSGYVQRGKDMMPRNAAELPWRISQDYLKDRQDMRQAPIDDGVLRFTRARELVEG